MLELGSPPAKSVPTPGDKPIDARILAATIAQLADAKKAEDIRVYNVDEKLKVADYFVVITCLNRAHVRGLFNEAHVRLKAAGEQHRPVEGADLGWWVVLDYVHVVVHILQSEAREYYDLDNLYGDCEQLDWATIETPELPESSTADV